MTLEELQEKYLAECEKNKTLTEDNNNLKSVNEKLKSDNERLIDYNNKLFMRVTTPTKPDAEQPREKTAEELEQEKINEIKKIMEDMKK